MEDLLKFVHNNLDADSSALRLKMHGKDTGFDTDLAITQIEARKKCRAKIPSLLKVKEFLFPNTLVAEQCTNEIIAKYHASLLGNATKVLDITAGLCIDSYYMSKSAQVTAIEIDSKTAEIDSHNMSILNANVKIINDDCTHYIADCKEKFDIIFADPARRDFNTGNKIVAFQQCEPNILKLLPKLKSIASEIYIKASPMIDISFGLKELNDVTDVSVVSVGDECKELLFKISNNSRHKITIHSVNFSTKGEMHYSYSHIYPCNVTTLISDKINPGMYIFEPGAGIIKSSMANYIANIYGLTKIHLNSFLYVGNSTIEKYPGRQFIITEILDYHSREMKSIGKKFPKLNITTRNFPISADNLRTQLKCKDGGDDYLFATTMGDNKRVLIFAQKTATCQ